MKAKFGDTKTGDFFREIDPEDDRAYIRVPDSYCFKECGVIVKGIGRGSYTPFRNNDEVEIGDWCGDFVPRAESGKE